MHLPSSIAASNWCRVRMPQAPIHARVRMRTRFTKFVAESASTLGSILACKPWLAQSNRL